MKILDVIIICVFAVAFSFLFYHYFLTPQEYERIFDYNFIKPIKENISKETSQINYSNQESTENKTNNTQINISEKENIPSQNIKFDTIKIANWNLQIFGDTKASKPEIMNFYANTLDDYDIIFIQEIRAIDGSAFNSLCSMLQDYNCKISSRAGRSSSKEQYGIIYKKGISIKEFIDYNPDSQNRWERPPIDVLFDIDRYDLRVYNIHTKPDDVSKELTSLEQVVSNEGNVVIIGDLNADCSYYDNEKEIQFDNWNWIIKDNDDTTVSSTDCAYDRIIINNDTKEEFISYSIFTEGITSDISDHYLVWVELKI